VEELVRGSTGGQAVFEVCHQLVQHIVAGAATKLAVIHYCPEVTTDFVGNAGFSK
jgi:hypothetical protein